MKRIILVSLLAMIFGCLSAFAEERFVRFGTRVEMKAHGVKGINYHVGVPSWSNIVQTRHCFFASRIYFIEVTSTCLEFVLASGETRRIIFDDLFHKEESRAKLEKFIAEPKISDMVLLEPGLASDFTPPTDEFEATNKASHPQKWVKKANVPLTRNIDQDASYYTQMWVRNEKTGESMTLMDFVDTRL